MFASLILSHRMRFKNFNSIYWMLAPIKILSRNEELAFDDCKRILDYLKGSLEQQVFQHHPDHCIIRTILITIIVTITIICITTITTRRMETVQL